MESCLPHHPAGWLIWLVVGAWVIPGASLRWSAAVLAIAWALAEDYACRTGDALPEKIYWPLDLLSIGAILFIIAWRGLACKDLFCPVNRREWMLLAPYPIMFAIYQSDGLSKAAEWWLLWAIVLFQFALAGGWPAIARNRTIQARRGLIAS
jgi:hypothetical protein